MIRKIIIVIFMMLILTGCKLREIEDYAIVSGIGVDYIDNEYQISFEIFEGNNGETIDLSSKVICVKGKSIDEAVTNINMMMSQKLYMNHCLVIIFGKEIINTKFSKIINYLIHDTRIRSSCYLVVSNEENARSLLEKSKELKQVISYNIYNQLEKNKKYLGVWSKCKFNQCMNEYLNKLNCVILPSISINESSTTINGAYVVKDEKTYTLTEETIFVSQLFHNDIKEGLFKAESYMYIKNCKSKVIIKNKVVNLSCDIEGLSYETDGRDLSNVFQQNEYIQEIKELLKYKIHKVFTEYKKIKLDIFGINKYIYKYHPILYKKIHTEYLDYFSELDLNIEIKIKLLSSGLTEDTLE